MLEEAPLSRAAIGQSARASTCASRPCSPVFREVALTLMKASATLSGSGE
jgi:hypothetical protein